MAERSTPEPPATITFRPDAETARRLAEHRRVSGKTVTDQILEALREFYMRELFASVLPGMGLEDALKAFERDCCVVGKSLWNHRELVGTSPQRATRVWSGSD